MKQILTLFLATLSLSSLTAQSNKKVPKKGGGKGGKGSETVITLGEKVESNKGGKGGKGGETVIYLGAGVNYFVPTNTQNLSTTPFLFLKNAQSVGLELTYAPNKKTSRVKLSADYIFGTNDENNIVGFAKKQDIIYTKTNFTKSKPSGFSIMASPQFMLFPKSTNKKLPLMWLDLKFGALFSNQQSLLFFNGQTSPFREVKSNAVNFVYNPTFVLNVVKTKKVFLNLRVSYSNWGGMSVGLGIAEQDCRGAPCCRCGTCCYCNPCATEINNSVNQ